MKKLLILLFSIFLLSSPSVFAMNASMSCKAASVSGDKETLKPNEYENTFPTIIINSDKKLVSYSYLKSEMRFASDYKITNENASYLIATYSDDAPEYIEVFHFNKKDKTFSRAYVGRFGNTIDYGKCFD